MFKIASLENKRANIGKVDVKVGGAIDAFKWDTKAVSQCVVGRDKQADDDYKRDLAKLEEYEKKVETLLEPPKPQDNQKGKEGKKDFSKMSVQDIEAYIQRQEEEQRKQENSLTNKSEDKKKRIQDQISSTKGRIKDAKDAKDAKEALKKKQTPSNTPASAAAPTPGGGRRRRVTVRRPRRS
jgi:chromatin segregation and condensation protein Rec8/ScpA/Scc1 (kleisin family)